MSEENDIFALVIVENGDVGKEFELTKKVTVIGRKAKDIRISDSSISGRHASLTLDGDGVLVKDLGSKNGTYINQEKIQEGRLELGDRLRLGQVTFALESGDKTLTAVSTCGTISPVPEVKEKEKEKEKEEIAPPAPVKEEVANPVLQEIEDDVSMMVFDDEQFSSLRDQTLTLEWNSKERDYIDFTDDGPDLKESEDIIEQRSEEKSLEVTTLMSGRILSKDYLPLKNGTFYAGKKGVELPGFYDGKSRALIEIQEQTPWLLKLENFQCRSSKGGELQGERWELKKGDTLFLESGVTQLMVRYGKTPPVLKSRPLLRFDRVDIQRFGISVASIVVLFLFALLFDTRKEEAKKKTVSVVYRPQPILRVKPKPKPMVVDAESGKKSGRKSPVTKNQKSVARKLPRKESRPSKQRKVAKAKPKKPAVKSYSLSRSKQNRLKNLFKSLGKSGTPRVVKDSSTKVKTLSQVREVAGNQSGVSASSANKIGKVGGGMDGKYDTSTGSRGLSSKHGASKVNYNVEPEVSGGIDAELLKRILRELIPQFQHCYRRELVRNNKLEGVVDLLFRINAEGRARNIRVEGKRFSFSPDGKSCMKKIFNLVELPKPPGGGVVDVKQALNFSSIKTGS